MGLLHLAIEAKLSILFAISKASRKNKNPTYKNWLNVLKIFRYLKGTKNYELKSLTI